MSDQPKTDVFSGLSVPTEYVDENGKRWRILYGLCHRRSWMTDFGLARLAKEMVENIRRDRIRRGGGNK